MRMDWLMLQDVRYAARSFRKAPLFTLATLAVIGLGVGANTAVFSIVNAVLLKPLYQSAIQDAGSVVMLWESNPALQGFLAQRIPVSLRNYLAWKKESQSFRAMGAFQDTNVTLSGAGKPEQVEAGLASIDFFGVLGVQSLAGRFFAAEDAAGTNGVAVLSSELFRRRFAADPAVIGTKLLVNGAPRIIAGVLPATFQLPAMWEGMDQKKPEIWIPLDTSETGNESALDARKNLVLARLRPGVSVAAARSEMAVLAQRMQAAFPQLNRGFGANVFPLDDEDVASNVRRMVLVLQAAVGFVLLIACANVANLLLARAAGREREIGVRLAVGAPPSRIIRQLLTENVLLSVAGGALGLLLATWSLSAISALAPPDVHGFHEMRVDLSVLLFTAAAVLVSGVLFGLAPALHAGHTDLARALSKGGRTGRSAVSGRVRRVLATVEVALTVMLLVGAGLMVRTFRALMSVDPGFRAEHLLRARIKLPPDQYGRLGQTARFCRELLDRVSALPGVVSAGIASGIPMQDLQMSGFRIDGAADPTPGSEPTADVRTVSETYFATLGMRLLRGRGFTRGEAESGTSTAVVVNQALAERYWPGQDAIGKSIIMGSGYGERRRRVVAGVVYDTRQLGLSVAPRPEIFFPSRELTEMSLVVQTAGDPHRMADIITGAVWAIDPDLPVYDVQGVQEIVRGSIAQERFNMFLLSVLSGLSLLLAGVGLYGILAYGVSLRTRELGIRLALGAEPGALVRLVLSEGLKIALVGTTAGVVGALALSRVMAGLLYGVQPTDPPTFCAIVVIVIGVALLATYAPARRASRLDPIRSLRIE